MNDPTVFWTVFKADMLMAGCSIALTLVITVAIARWRRKRVAANPPITRAQGPRAIILGGNGPEPGHCPLCGRGWPLPGPEAIPPPQEPGKA